MLSQFLTKKRAGLALVLLLELLARVLVRLWKASRPVLRAILRFERWAALRRGDGKRAEEVVHVARELRLDL